MAESYGILRVLKTYKLITAEQEQAVIAEAKKEDKQVISAIVDMKLVPADKIREILVKEYAYPYLNLDDIDVKEIPSAYMDKNLILQHHALPVYAQGKTLFLAMSDPTNTAALNAFGLKFQMMTDTILVDEDKLQKDLNKLFADAMEELDVGLSDTDMSELETIEEDQSNDAMSGASDASDDDTPVVKFINKLLLDSIKKGASDLHFEP